MKRLLPFFAFLFIGASPAQAGLMVEPFINYGVSGEVDANTNLGAKGDLNFLSFGGRVAYSMLGFFVGAEYALYNEADFTGTGTTSGTFKYKMSGISAIVGYNLPVLLRVYGGYTLSYTGTMTNPTNVERDIDGKGFFIGAGYSIVPMVSLNVEYRSHTLDESTLSGTKTTLTDAKDNQIMVGVSVPLSIPFL